MFGATGGSSPDPSKLPPTLDMLEYVQQLKEQLQEQELLTPEIEDWNPEQYSRRIVAQGINWLVSLRRNTTSAGPLPWQQVPERPAQTPGEAAAQELADTRDQLAQEKTAREELEEKLAATKAELERECTDREAAEAERKQEHDARVAAEAKMSQLENNLVPATSKDAEIKKLRSRIKGLRGGAARARLEERAKSEGCIENLKQKLADTTGQHSQELAARDSRINKIEKELDESRRKVLTFDFLETWCGLEDKLNPLKRGLMQSGETSDMPSQLRRLLQQDRINRQQFMHLENMRAQRNDIVHSALLLTTSQARANLSLLKQVIDQL